MFTPTKKTKSGKPKAFNALRRQKCRLQARLNALKKSKTSLPEHIKSVHNKLALVCYEMKEAINKKLDMRETLAVQRIKSNPKYFYSYAKSKSLVRHNISMLYNKTNNIVTDKKCMADILQDEFISACSNPNSADVKSPNFPKPEIKHPFDQYKLSISIDDVISAIKDINASSAPGPDGISVVVLKACGYELCEPIISIWSESYQCGIVPTFYKQGKISPFHKKGDHTRAGNYNLQAYIFNIP